MSDAGGFEALERDVLNSGFCVLCGACTGFCDRLELDYEEGRPKLVGSCLAGCSICYDHCPMRTGFNPNQVFGNARRDDVLGPLIEVKAVRAIADDLRKDAQNGGAVTAILTAIMEKGKIDAAVVVERDEFWRPIPKVITSIDGLHRSRGSKYSPSPNTNELGQVFRNPKIKSVAFVDVGCHIRSLRNLEYDLLYNAGFSPYSDLKIYTIGLFCSGTFEVKNLIRHLNKDPKRISKMDITKGRFNVRSNGKNEFYSVTDFHEALLPACSMCSDYPAELADISIGSIGSPEGYSTVIVRNLMGWGMLRDAVQKGLVEATESLVDEESLKKQITRKKDRANAAVSKRIEEGRPIPSFIKS